MNSPLPQQWPGHYFSTWDAGVVGGSPLMGDLTGAPTELRGTDPAGYAALVLGQFGVLKPTPASELRGNGPGPEVSVWAKVAVVVIGVVVLLMGVWMIAGPEARAAVTKAAVAA